MALGPGRAGASAEGGPTAPTHRPTWLLILSSITLVYGGLMLVSGLSALRNPASVTSAPLTRPLAPEAEALAREMSALNDMIVARHAGAIRGRAAASTVLALLMLYSAAAALSRDRRGRTVTLAAAWLGIVYQIGSLPLVIPIANDYARASAPMIARMVASETAATTTTTTTTTGGGASGASTSGDAGTPAAAEADAPPRPETLAALMHTLLLGVPIGSALLGIMGSLLLITYFGGRRGRALYGLPPRPPRS
jgi:hypothetical protein